MIYIGKNASGLPYHISTEEENDSLMKALTYDFRYSNGKDGKFATHDLMICGCKCEIHVVKNLPSSYNEKYKQKITVLGDVIEITTTKEKNSNLLHIYKAVRLHYYKKGKASQKCIDIVENWYKIKK